MSDTTVRLDDAGRPMTDQADPTLQLGRFKSPSQESNLKSLASNLKDFLTERPVRIKGDAPGARFCDERLRRRHRR